MASNPRIVGFNAAEFREGIRTAMAVGLPPGLEDQPAFVTPAAIDEGGVERDVDGVPFDWQETREKVGEDTVVQVECAVEFFDAFGQHVAFGSMAATKIVLTLLDEEYDQVKGFSYVVIAGNKYSYQRTEPPIGMVDVAIWRIHCTTDDEG